MFDKEKYKNLFIKNYTRLKEKKVDKYLITAGIVGVVIGLVFSVPIINEIFAWFILLGFSMKMYDFVEETKRNIVPYDFNNLLPPPSKNKTKK